jgi:two-component system phosphate regulon sensor histidine kinase PhoR
LDSIEYGVLTIDKSGTVTAANPAACDLLQMQAQELVGKQGRAVLPLCQKRKCPVIGDHPITKVITQRVPYHSHPSLHISLFRKDQTTMPINLLIVPLTVGEDFFGALAVFQDMSVQRQIDYMKSEFISLASHQLRTPLSSIRWYIEILTQQKAKLPAEHRTYLQEVDVAAKRMANLIEALLRVSKLEDGGIMPEMQMLDLSNLLRKLTDGWHTTATENGIALNVHIPSAPCMIKTDPTLLEIVLQNLFVNSMKYSPTKKPISLHLLPNKTHVRVTVRDQGMGIPEADQKRLFEKFFRARNVREIDTDGTGLGLYMSKSILERLGGALSFESEVGKGSTFTVTLPL